MITILKKLDPPIDYVGQSLANKLQYVIFIIGYSAALIMGVVFSNLIYTLYIGIVTVLVAFLVLVPSWGFYRRHPLKFVKAVKEKNE